MASSSTLEGVVGHVNNNVVFINHSAHPKGVFYFNKTKLSLQKGTRVHFTIDENVRPNKGRYSANVVTVLDSSDDVNHNNGSNRKRTCEKMSNGKETRRPVNSKVFKKTDNNNDDDDDDDDDEESKHVNLNRTSKQQMEWHECLVVNTLDVSKLKVKPLKQVEGFSLQTLQVQLALLPQHILQVQVGDTLNIGLKRIQRATADRTFLNVSKAKILKYQRRSPDQLEEYVNSLMGLISSPLTRDVVLLHTIPVKPLWQMLFLEGQQPDEHSDQEEMAQSYRLAYLLQNILKTCAQRHTAGLKTVVESFLNSPKIVMGLQRLLKQSEDGQSHVVLSALCELISHRYVDLRSKLEPLIANLSRHGLLTLVSGLLNFSAGKGRHWHLTPILPEVNELLPKKSDKTRSKLSPFTTSFEDSDAYMEHFYHLMRQDASHLLLTGIKKFKDNTLDPRDLLIFKGIHLEGVQVENVNTHLLVSFDKCLTRKKLPSDWSRSSILTFGSLVCLMIKDSDNANHEDVIWATVSDRDDDDLKKRVLGISLLSEYNTLSPMQILLKLTESNSSEIVMFESPTLFSSVGPVLQSLKECRLNEFLLRKEIVEAKPHHKRPKYIDALKPVAGESSNSLERTGLNFLNRDQSAERLLKRQHSLDSAIEDLKPSLDEAQYEALKNVFKQRLSIIQGPPGCGKTFLGVKIVELFLTHCSTIRTEMKDIEHEEDGDELVKPAARGSSGAILLLTYKNHALDEFLKHVKDVPCFKKHWESKMLRIGGRSSEPELECVNLKSVLKEQRGLVKFDFQEEYFDTMRALDEHRKELHQALSDFVSSTKVTPDNFFKYLDESQMKDLLFNTPWHLLKVKFGTDQYLSLGDIKVKFERANTLTSGAHFLLIKGVIDDEELDNDQIRHLKHFLIWTLNIAALHWWPERRHLEILKSVIDQCPNDNGGDDIDISEEERVQDDDDDQMEEEEVDHMNEILDARLSNEESNYRDSKTKSNKSKDEKKHSNAFWMENSPKNNESKRLIGLNDMNSQLGNTNFNPSMLTNLSEIQKVRFILGLIGRNRDEKSVPIESTIAKIQVLQERFKALEIEKRFAAIKGRSVVGVTITGASINRELLGKLNPTLVVVEEAAEILEPSLLAALSSQVEHLVMIGDHKQLKPQVESYELAKRYHLDTSMMERLIMAEYPYSKLRLQSRMRPEFALLLKDIYPEYESNLKHVANRKALLCLKKSMYLWNHEFKEDAADKDQQDQGLVGRSKVNTREADMVIALALFILATEPQVQPNQITIIASYLGQTKHIRKRLEALRSSTNSRLSKLLVGKNDEDHVDNKLHSLKVSTIDMYQGDENDYVIVSLVRANDRGDIGFVNTMNRRCVAQSRAKKGMYFVCNTESLCKRQSKVWPPFIQAMKQAGYFGNAIPVKCPKHPAQSQMCIEKARTLMDLVTKNLALCSQPCNGLFPCGLQAHACTNLCSKCDSSHITCMSQVDFVHKKCGHVDKRRCYEDEFIIKCQTIVHFTFQTCGHPGTRKCHVDEKTKKCKIPCPAKMANCSHPCPLKCGQLPHDHQYCSTQVQFTHPDCRHQGVGTKDCSGPINTLCKQKVLVTLSKCGHGIEKMCYQKESDLVCKKDCTKMNDCERHKCHKKCGEHHTHDVCLEKVEYVFPTCGHPSPKRKLCSEKITWPCSHVEYVQHEKCGHVVKKRCFQQLEEIVCEHEPCPRKRSDCRHECLLRCGDDCLKVECKVCKMQFEANRKIQREKVNKRIKELERQVQKEAPNAFRIVELRDMGDTKAEYSEIQDTVMLTLKEEHAWYPRITAIKKVTNLKLELNFEKAVRDAILPDRITMKFHGTSKEGVDGIVRDGFKLPTHAGMYGKGVYLATNSSKSAQLMYTKNSNKLLLCRVLLGRSKEILASDSSMDLSKLRMMGYDSIIAPRGSAVKNDEFVVYDPRQAYPVYIIEYSTGVERITCKINTTANFELVQLKQSRSFDINDEKGRLWDVACSVLKRFPSFSNNPTKIEYIVNKSLEAKFEDMKKLLASKKKPTQEILAFHGTKSKNINNIASNNLDMKCCTRFAYGRGFYLSEYPNVSQGYGDGLFLFRVLPGKEFVDSSDSDIPSDYDSKKLPGSHPDYGQMNIIPKPNQLLPFFIYHFQ